MHKIPVETGGVFLIRMLAKTARDDHQPQWGAFFAIVDVLRQAFMASASGIAGMLSMPEPHGRARFP